QLARAAIEADRGRVSEAVGPDLRRTIEPDERVVRRDVVAQDLGPDLDAQDAAFLVRAVLAVPERLAVAETDVVLVPTVAERDVQVAIVAEDDRATVVVHVWMVVAPLDAARGDVERILGGRVLG